MFYEYSKNVPRPFGVCGFSPQFWSTGWRFKKYHPLVLFYLKVFKNFFHMWVVEANLQVLDRPLDIIGYVINTWQISSGFLNAIPCILLRHSIVL